MSTRQKKIKMRLYLHDRLAAHPNHPDEYPLYLYINFLGQNTKLSITDQGHVIYWSQEMLNEFNAGKREGRHYTSFYMISQQLEIIERVLRYEHRIQGD